jgi:hypothetical protein
MKKRTVGKRESKKMKEATRFKRVVEMETDWETSLARIDGRGTGAAAEEWKLREQQQHDDRRLRAVEDERARREEYGTGDAVARKVGLRYCTRVVCDGHS